ncbi:export membrane protein SecF [Bacteriovorax sp. BSW11_IV]|uniref:protein translocase subunit SecF n=1 Tax=Bacteriovorax sp. BSW11_IV TaxID=1353529 RepID=UPI00038A15DC|nr:protein translocase subunit SecF [Bacteriovorax sp. BSW11_IV]EQC48517.1 export membrane protein SecF [Bacteriovorax sp. BSW11_IV]
MLEVISSNSNINFTGKFKLASILSIVLVLGSLFFSYSKLKFGVDFRGGAEVQVKFADNVKLDDLRGNLVKSGFKGLSAQTIGEQADNEFLLKVAGDDENLNTITQSLTDTLNKNYASQGVEIRKVDIVGPKAGAQLRISGFQAMLWALIAIMIYIALRFDFKYSPGAIVALFHDVSIILGVFALTGTEFTLQTVAAILAVIGYSVNDTVIVYDRVREHEGQFVGRSLAEHINNAVNETLPRTILTSGTTLFVCITMLMFGGLAIRDFFLAMTIGIVVGTYSSIFIASPITLMCEKFQKNKEPANETVKA